MTDAALHDPTDEPDAKRRRVTPDGFVTDAELIRWLNLPEKVGRRALMALDAGLPAVPDFPQPDPTFGNRRWLPAVIDWLSRYYGLSGIANRGTPPQGGITWPIDRLDRRAS